MTENNSAIDRSKRIVKLKLDVIFKRVFGDEKNMDIITAFVSDLLDLPRESVKAVYIENVEIAPEFFGRKYSRLDLKLKVDDRIVNVEIQVNYEPAFKERTLYYWSKLYGGDLREGEEYDKLAQTICINIINFNLFECEEFHSHFQALEKNRHELLTDKFAIHFFELKKVGEVRTNSRKEQWMTLVKAETEGDLMELEQTTTVPEIGKTIVVLRRLSADEKIQQEAWYREKQLHDEANAINGSWREGREEGLAEGIAQGIVQGEETGGLKKLAHLVRKGRLSLTEAAEDASMTVEEFQKFMEQNP